LPKNPQNFGRSFGHDGALNAGRPGRARSIMWPSHG
jgi:hypothetical protein